MKAIMQPSKLTLITIVTIGALFTISVPAGAAVDTGIEVRISGEPGGTDFVNASAALKLRWLRGGGDYLDRNGVVNGPNHHLTIPVDGSVRDFAIDVSGVPGDLILRFEPGSAPGWDSVLVDGKSAAAFWVDASTNHALGGPTVRMPMFVHGGTLLTMHLASLPGGAGTLTIDPVAMPVLADLQMVGPSAPPDILDFELTDETSLRKLAPGQIAEPFAFDPEWRMESNGLASLRFASANGPRLISWFLYFPPQESVYARYCIFIEDDVADGMTELGVKLPGLAGGEVSWRMEHGPVAPGNRGLYSVVDYLYDAESGPGFGTISDMNATFRAGRWYTVEQFVKLNTPGVGDGTGRVWINGHLTWESTHVKFRDDAATRISNIHVNVYHGGLGVPKAPIHYRIASIAVSHSYIGPPLALLAGANAQAIEYYHATFDHYFMTADPSEISILDRGDLPGWARTGEAIDIDDDATPEAVPVCRFFSTSFAKSSHFYTADPSECAVAKANADWQFEGEVFRMRLPDAAGGCPPSTRAVYRLYNNGNGGAPNHRYTESAILRGEMLGLGWISEGRGVSGVAMCAPD